MTSLTRLSEKFGRLSIEKNKEFFSVKDVQQIIDEEIKTIEKIKASQPKDVFHFGKYKAKKIEDIAKIDKPYIEWLMKQPWVQNKDELKKYL